MKKTTRYSYTLLAGVLLVFSNTRLLADEFSHEDHDPLEISTKLLLKDVLEHTLLRDPRNVLVEQYKDSADAYKQLASRPYAAPLGLDLHYQTDRLISDKGLREWEANLEIPLWRRGQRQAVQAIGTNYEKYIDIHSEVLRYEIAGLIRDILWELTIANERKNLAKQTLHKVRELEQEVFSRERAGDLAPIDKLLAHDETLAKQLEYVTQNMEYMHVAERYTALTGLTQRPAFFTEIRSTGEDSINEHPLIKEILVRIERAQHQLDQVRSSRGEPVHLTLGVRNEKGSVADVDITSVGIGIRVPLGSQHFQQPAMAQAKTTLAELLAEKIRIERALHIQIHNAEHELATVRQQLDVVRQRQATAQENLRMARAAFRAGELDVGQLLRVASQTAAAEMQFVIHQLEEKQAIARINQALGRLP